jgi:hypothetical protein
MTSAIIGLIGVIIGSLLTTLKDFLLSSIERRRHARYAAIRIVCVLDEYVNRCIAVVFDDGTSEGRPAGRTEDGEYFCEPQVSTPAPPAYPKDIDWKSILTALMYRVLSLPNRARETAEYVTASAEHAFPPGYEEIFEARQEGYAQLGLEAHRLAAAFRKAYGIPPTDEGKLNPDWDPVKSLSERLGEIKSRRLKGAEHSKSWLEDINSETVAS